MKEQKKVLFDGIATQGTKDRMFHGGGEYAKFMLKYALEKGYVFDIVFDTNMITDKMIEQLLLIYKSVRVYEVNNKQEIYDLIEREQYDRFYTALPNYSDYKGKAELVGVVHGLRFAELPWDDFRYQYFTSCYMRMIGRFICFFKPIQSFLRNRNLRHYREMLSIRNAKYITVSQHTKYSMLSFFPNLSPENIKVYYSPFVVRQIKEYPQKKDYFLMISGNRYEKNVYRAAFTFDKLFSDGRLVGKKVVITGCGNLKFWKKLRNKERFELLPYVSGDELELMYAGAFCFVYPSLNEGFGYPPLKAMAYGTPVIASSATSIPEVCDDAACYFSPHNTDDLASRVLRINHDESYRSCLVAKGIARVRYLLEKQNLEIEKEIKMIFE